MSYQIVCLGQAMTNLKLSSDILLGISSKISAVLLKLPFSFSCCLLVLLDCCPAERRKPSPSNVVFYQLVAFYLSIFKLMSFKCIIHLIKLHEFNGRKAGIKSRKQLIDVKNVCPFSFRINFFIKRRRVV